jgi:hypothetical protein
MKFLSTQLGLFWILLLSFVVAHGQNHLGNTETVPLMVAQGVSVPKLNITWNCGSCTHNTKIIPLIQQAYADEAKNNGRSISSTAVAEVEIIEFRQRNPGARVMFGVMAGKDRLGLKITYKDAEYYTSDYSANVIQGMNHLCAAVASESYQKLDMIKN